MGTDLAVVDATVIDSPEPLSEDKAKALNERIQQACIMVADNQATLLDLLEEAAAGQIHIALGMSWKAWFKENVNVTPVDASERRALVAMMSGKGCSQREIGELLHINQSTASRDLAESPPDANASPVTIGLDEKTYKRKPKQDVIDAEIIEESIEEKLARVAIEAEEAEEWDEPEPEPRTAIDVINDFGINMDYLMPAVQAFTDQLNDDAELFPKARKRIAKSYLNPLQAMIADLQLVVDELMEK